MTARGATARVRLSRLALRGSAGLALGFVLVPLFLVSWLSFFRNEVVSFPPEGYTLRWFPAILEQENFVGGFLTSLEVGTLAMLAGLAVGVPASLCLVRHRFRGREALNTLLLLPLVVPGVVAGTAIYVFQVEAEILTGLPLVASLPGLVLAHILFVLPKNAPNKAGAYAYLDAMLEPSAQVAFAETMGYNATVSNAKLPDAIGKRVGFSKDEQAKLITPNYDYIAKNDAPIKEWWDKVFKA